MSFARKMMSLIQGVMFKHVPLMISCEEFEGFILDYLEGSLPAGQRRVFDLHMKMCRECRDYLAAYRRSVEIGKVVFQEPSDPVPDDVPDDLVEAILQARRG